METLTVTLRHPKAMQLLIDLEAMDLINIGQSNKKIKPINNSSEMEKKLLRRLKNVREGKGIEVNIDTYLQ